MRTKTLLLAADLAAATNITSAAQASSPNIGGYINQHGMIYGADPDMRTRKNGIFVATQYIRMVIANALADKLYVQ